MVCKLADIPYTQTHSDTQAQATSWGGHSQSIVSEGGRKSGLKTELASNSVTGKSRRWKVFFITSDISISLCSAEVSSCVQMHMLLWVCTWGLRQKNLQLIWKLKVLLVAWVSDCSKEWKVSQYLCVTCNNLMQKWREVEDNIKDLGQG